MGARPLPFEAFALPPVLATGFSAGAGAAAICSLASEEEDSELGQLGFAVPREERVPDLGFEFLDRRVERRERDVEGVCGSREMQLLGDCDETSKQGDVHGEPFVGPREPRPFLRLR